MTAARLALAGAAALFAAALVAQPYTPPPAKLATPATTAREAGPPGEALFAEKCGMCHRKGGMGTVLLARRLDPKTAELEARTDLAADYVVTAARTGIGNMPRISRGEASDRQLAAIAAYLAKGRK